MTKLIATHWPFAEFPDGTGVVLNATSVDFTAPLTDAGSFTVEMLMADAYANTPEPGDIFTIDIEDFDGNPTRAFAGIYRDAEYITKDPGEANAQRVTFSGPGHLSILGDGRIEPPGGVGRFPTVTDFVFDYTHPDYDDSSWINASEVCTVEFAQLNASNVPATPNVDGRWGLLQVFAPDFPQHAIAGVGSGDALILWASDGTVDGLTTGIGDCYFRDKFTSPFDGMLADFFAGDNIVENFIDGKSMGVAGTGGNPLTSGFANTTLVPVSLSASEHTIAMKGQNLVPFGAPNPGGVAGAIYVYGYPPILVWQTTTGMKILEYAPTTPGMTVGTVERLMLEAQQALGRFSFITLNMTDELDADANAWNVTPTISVKAGTDDCYSTNLSIMATYADVVMDPNGWTLRAFNWGALNPSSGVIFDTGDLTSLRYKRQDLTADELIILSGVGWSRDGTGGRRQGFLQLGAVNNVDEVGRLGDSALGALSNPRESIELTYEARSNSELPWTNSNFIPGCDVTVPARTGGTLTDRAVQIGASFSADTAERVMVTVVVKDKVLQDQERLLNSLAEKA